MRLDRLITTGFLLTVISVAGGAQETKELGLLAGSASAQASTAVSPQAKVLSANSLPALASTQARRSGSSEQAVDKGSDADQYCMICTDNKYEISPGKWFVIADWGSSLDCQGIEEVAEDCARCEDFDWMDPNADCGDEGHHEEPSLPDYYEEEYADLILRTSGCASAPCEVSELPSMAEIITLVSERDLDGLADILRDSELIMLNADRRAIQGLGCAGLVILHVQLDDIIYELLADELALPPDNPGLPAGPESALLLLLAVYPQIRRTRTISR
jgi:hypothetical protein